MASLHIVLGYPSRDKGIKPAVLFADHNGETAVQVRDEALKPGSGYAVVEHIRGAAGYRKTNERPVIDTPADLAPPIESEVETDHKRKHRR